MHPKVQQAVRRVHGVEFKAKVLAQCREPGPSVAAVTDPNLAGKHTEMIGPILPTGDSCHFLFHRVLLLPQFLQRLIQSPIEDGDRHIGVLYPYAVPTSITVDSNWNAR